MALSGVSSLSHLYHRTFTMAVTDSGSGSQDQEPEFNRDVVLKGSDPIPKEWSEVSGIEFDDYKGRDITVAEMIAGMTNTGFQATGVAEAVRIINKMRSWRGPEPGDKSSIFLGYTSNLVSSGLRSTIRYLVQHKHVSYIVTTAGGIEEDLIKCLSPTYVHSWTAKGANLREKGWNRIGNLIVPGNNYKDFEDWIIKIYDDMLEKQQATRNDDKPVVWTPRNVIKRLGMEIGKKPNHESSICYWAYKNDIPVFCPAFTDGSLGDMLCNHKFESHRDYWANKRDAFVKKPPVLDISISRDMHAICKYARRAKRRGIIILGGGLVKHHIANACLAADGAEEAVYVNTAQEFDGSDAGASPEEALSWGKIAKGGDSVKVFADATIVFPMIVAATFAKAQQGVDNEDPTTGPGGDGEDSKRSDKHKGKSVKRKHEDDGGDPGPSDNGKGKMAIREEREA